MWTLLLASTVGHPDVNPPGAVVVQTDGLALTVDPAGQPALWGRRGARWIAESLPPDLGLLWDPILEDDGQQAILVNGSAIWSRVAGQSWIRRVPLLPPWRVAMPPMRQVAFVDGVLHVGLDEPSPPRGLCRLDLAHPRWICTGPVRVLGFGQGSGAVWAVLEDAEGAVRVLPL